MRTQEARSLGGCLQDAVEAEGGADLLGCCAQAPTPPPLRHRLVAWSNSRLSVIQLVLAAVMLWN